ncbi:MAG: 7-cyano-7-deazaguanine synthase, partial [Candidatus Methylomirabilota bacterium]
MSETIAQIRERVRKAQINYCKNMETIENILLNERGYVSRAPKNEGVVVLYSGGLDSSILINKIIEDWNVSVYPLFFRRGARAQKYEENAFDFFVDFYRKRFPKNMKQAFKIDCGIPPADIKNSLPKELAQTQGHPMRNSTMQNMAAMYAVSLKRNVKTIFTGSVAEDNTEPELGMLSLRAQTLNTCVNLGDWEWQITSPLTDNHLKKIIYGKEDLINYAADKNIPLGKTRTCFSQYEIADGSCFACR